jgi:hypothetical protein
VFSKPKSGALGGRFDQSSRTSRCSILDGMSFVVEDHHPPDIPDITSVSRYAVWQPTQPRITLFSYQQLFPHIAAGLSLTLASA